MSDKVCENCKWFRPYYKGYSLYSIEKNGEGECRRYPQELVIYDIRYYCGEWKSDSDE